MAEKKSILEEALLDIKKIESTLDANTKEILRSVAKEEIDGVVKESLEKDYEEEEVKETESESEKMTKGKIHEEGMEEEMSEEKHDMEEGTYEEGKDAMASEELDLTNASDDDVISIYKKMTDDDDIEIVGDEIHLKVSEPGEYIVKTSELEHAEEEPEMDLDADMGADDDVDYEIEMDDEEPSDLEPAGEEGSKDMEEMEEGKEEMTEEMDENKEEDKIEEKIGVGIGMSVGTHRGKGPKSIGAPENPKSESLNEVVAAKKLVSETSRKYNVLLTEAKKLKAENEDFRKALKEFRTKLVETVVFNSNLTYVTKLFTEHSTTKAEKQSIMKRFDEEATSLKESKKLYKSIVHELDSRKPINESVENKIIKEVSTGSSKHLTENTAYVDPSTKRILDLINRVEKK
jgi:hypothetical protein